MDDGFRHPRSALQGQHDQLIKPAGLLSGQRVSNIQNEVKVTLKKFFLKNFVEDFISFAACLIFLAIFSDQFFGPIFGPVSDRFRFRFRLYRPRSLHFRQLQMVFPDWLIQSMVLLMMFPMIVVTGVIAVNQPTMTSLNWNLMSLSLMMNRIDFVLFQHLLLVHKWSIFPKNLQMDLVVWHKSFSFQLLAFCFFLTW